MNFHKIVRQWTKVYEPMKDDEEIENRRFYLTDTSNGVVELAKKLTPKMTPCVAMESVVEGGGKLERPNRNYPIYFYCRARDMSDGDCASEATEEAWFHAQQFLAWLKKKHDDEMDSNIDGDFARIELDNAWIEMQTIGPLHDGWYAVMIQLERAEPLNLCVDESLYIDPEDEEEDDSDSDSE